ncbi:uncharacterized protein LOC127286949 [Leptopilina boulardi]|uniref:uncharacterized protein LOC127286949 n=1 Tax=Leptopilina boulardi TaxID=63433 RepID=UPI0021F5CE86|nr:uncharacterized protein LOC127286949 [Leptopilina boulardi]
MKSVVFLVGIVLLQINNIKCDVNVSQCASDLLIPEEKLQELKQKQWSLYCRQVIAYKNKNIIDDNFNVNEENLKAALQKRVTDPDKLERLIQLRMECASKIKDVKNQCEFVGVWNSCVRKAYKSDKKDTEENDDENQ